MPGLDEIDNLLKQANEMGLKNRVAERLDFLNQALDLHKTLISEPNLKRAEILKNLAVAHGDAGDNKKQKELIRETLAIEKLCNAGDIIIAKTIMTLGNAIADNGDIREAIELLTQALTMQENKLGEDDIEAATIRKNLANAYGIAGNWEKEIELASKSLSIQKAYYGDEHLRVAISMLVLADGIGASGDVVKERELLEDVLKMQIKLNGVKDWRCAFTMKRLADAYGKLGNAELQKTLAEEAVGIESAHYKSKDHWQVVLGVRSYANAIGLLGDPKGQLYLLRLMLPVQEQFYKAPHWQVAVTLKSMAKGYLALNDFANAEKVLQEALSIQVVHYGENHPWVLQTREDLSLTQEKLYNSIEIELLKKEASILAKQELRLTEELLVKLTDKTAGYLRAGDFANAKSTLHEILSLQEMYYGRDHEKTLKTQKKLNAINGAHKTVFFNDEAVKPSDVKTSKFTVAPQL